MQLFLCVVASLIAVRVRHRTVVDGVVPQANALAALPLDLRVIPVVTGSGTLNNVQRLLRFAKDLTHALRVLALRAVAGVQPPTHVWQEFRQVPPPARAPRGRLLPSRALRRRFVAPIPAVRAALASVAVVGVHPQARVFQARHMGPHLGVVPRGASILPRARECRPLARLLMVPLILCSPRRRIPSVFLLQLSWL